MKSRTSIIAPVSSDASPEARVAAYNWEMLTDDLCGHLAFPIQVAILLSEPNEDFTGGEFALTEQRPRMQSRVEVVPLRHGISRVRTGMRHTVGIIFHDAR